MIIPIVGPILVMGYALICFQSWREQREPYPEFDFTYFGDYLRAGAWPFLVTFVWGLILVPIIWLLIAIIFVPVVAISGETGEKGILIIGVGVGIAVVSVIQLLFMAFLTPAIIKSGLEQNFSSGFHFEFIKDFLKRVGWETLATGIVLFFSSLIAAVLGWVALCLGIFFAMAWQAFFTWHMHFQLYEKYLERGGRPVHVSPDLSFGHLQPQDSNPPQIPPGA